jgi:hypothetical protein
MAPTNQQGEDDDISETDETNVIILPQKEGYAVPLFSMHEYITIH